MFIFPIRRSVAATAFMLALEACTTSPSTDYSRTASEAVYTNLLTAPTVRPSVAGALKYTKVNGAVTLVGEHGKPMQLRGMSTTGLQWFPQIVNDRAFKALSRDWGANVIRLAMYVGEGGYATKPELKDKVVEGIQLAIANDMYVIVDWHVLTPGDPHAPVYAGAKDFFQYIASRFPNNKHIIYELVNEPNPGSQPGNSNDAAGWSRIKSYADPIIEMLRKSGNANLILVGTPNWAQRPDLAGANPIADANVGYTFHFYTGTHKASDHANDRGNVMSNVRFALAQGIPVFASEWGTSEADGNKGPYLKEADQWLDFLNKNNISWVNWSLTTKNETSAAFAGMPAAASADPGTDYVWSPNELSPSGEYVRSRIRGIAYRPVKR